MRIFLILFIISSRFDFISTLTIENDLAEITKLSEDFKKYSPDIARHFTEATCQMIFQCCPQIQSQFILTALMGHPQGLTDQCFGEKTSSNFLTNVFSCRPFIKVITMVTNPQLIKYASILSKTSDQQKEDMKLILDVCSTTEIQSVACEWNRTDLQNSCQRKVLEKLAQSDEKFYQHKVQQTKQEYITLINKLKKVFNN